MQDTVNLARLTLNGHDFINAQTDDYTHVFLGSVLSERAVKESLQENIHPEARYGTEHEDKSPTKADVVFPISGGDMYVQVKMKWTKDTDLKVQPKKQPPHVIVPMQYMRSNLTTDEHARVTEIISAAAERKAEELRWQKAYAMSGLKKHIALWRIPTGQFKNWWAETKEVIGVEKQALRATGQTEVNRIELEAA